MKTADGVPGHPWHHILNLSICVQKYFDTMPWKAVPHKAAVQVAKSFSVTTIPRMMVVGPDGRIQNADAVQRVVRDPEGKDFPWVGEPSLW